MKLIKLTNLLVIGLVLTVAASGCRKRPTPLTVLPGQKTGAPEQPGPGEMLGTTKTNPDETAAARDKEIAGGISQPNPDQFANYIPNTEIFKEDVIYFDFDSSVIKSSERSKLAKVADYMKSHTADALRVEGNCDERGTEEYNRALGERRALAARDELVRLGVDANHVLTTSYGKDKPQDPGHNESAWRKNRRDDFVLLTPPAAP